MPSYKNVFSFFLKRLKIKHTQDYADKLFNEHPHKNNLYGLSDMLTVYGIKNAGFKIEHKEEIYSVTTPFIMISTRSLQGATMLNKSEMKSISGGTGMCCAYAAHWSDPGFICINYGGSPAEAQFMAEEDGWWACNTPEIWDVCCP